MLTNMIKPLTCATISTPDVAADQNRPFDGSICVVRVDISTNREEWEQALTFPVIDPVEIVLGNGASPADFLIENCLLTMVVGETRAITVTTSDLNPESATSASTSELKLELLSVDNSIPPLWKISQQDLVERTGKLKEEGIEFFKQNKIRPAFWKFSKATKLMIVAKSISAAEKTDVIKHLELTLHLNIAACQLKNNHFDLVVDNCTKALMLDNSNVKAYFRRGVALINLKEYEKAMADLQKVLTLESGNTAALHQMKILKHNIQSSNKSLGQALHHMFN